MQDMSREVRLKEELMTLRLLLGAIIAIDVSVITWLVQNFAKGDVAIVILAIVTAVAVTVVLLLMLKSMFRLSDQLEVQ